MKFTLVNLCLVLSLNCLIERSPADDKLDFFEKNIRPVLVDSCIECHGDDEAGGKLRLDSKKGWSRGGERGPAIVPGDPTASLLFRAISHRSEKLRMPPSDHAERLTPRQIDHFEKWIRDGATDPRTGKVERDIDIQARSHWAFQPVMTESIDFGSKNQRNYTYKHNFIFSKFILSKS